MAMTVNCTVCERPFRASFDSSDCCSVWCQVHPARWIVDVDERRAAVKAYDERERGMTGGASHSMLPPGFISERDGRVYTDLNLLPVEEEERPAHPYVARTS